MRFYQRGDVAVSVDVAPVADPLEALVEAVARLRQLRLSVKSAEAAVRDLARKVAGDPEQVGTVIESGIDPASQEPESGIDPGFKPPAWYPAPKPPRRTNAYTRVMRFLVDIAVGECFTAKSVIESAPCPESSAHKVLTELRTQGYIERVGRGVYRKL